MDAAFLADFRQTVDRAAGRLLLISDKDATLRPAPGKESAEIHDFLAVPPTGAMSDEILPSEQTILRRELRRFREFADTATNPVTVGFDKPGICVDTHVHRISNRLGYVRTRTPKETEMALRAKLPRRYWIGYNDLLVTFGQNVCAPISPKCSICPVRALCRRVGVTTAR